MLLAEMRSPRLSENGRSGQAGAAVDDRFRDGQAHNPLESPAAEF